MSAQRIYIAACGSAYHAGVVGKYVLEAIAGIPVEVTVASEFRYGPPLFEEDSLTIVISQSGETADTLAALRLAKQKGAKTLAIVNVIGSSIAREADNVIYTMAGPEIAVASTKAYSVQTALLYLLSIEAARVRGYLEREAAKTIVAALYERVPDAIAEIIARDSEIKSAAKILAAHEDAFYIGFNLLCQLYFFCRSVKHLSTHGTKNDAAKKRARCQCKY